MRCLEFSHWFCSPLDVKPSICGAAVLW